MWIIMKNADRRLFFKNQTIIENILVFPNENPPNKILEGFQWVFVVFSRGFPHHHASLMICWMSSSSSLNSQFSFTCVAIVEIEYITVE